MKYRVLLSADERCLLAPRLITDPGLAGPFNGSTELIATLLELDLRQMNLLIIQLRKAIDEKAGAEQLLLENLLARIEARTTHLI